MADTAASYRRYGAATAWWREGKHGKAKSCMAKRAVIHVYEDPGLSLGVAVHGGNVEQQRGAQERYQHRGAAASRCQLQQARLATARASLYGTQSASIGADDDNIVWSWSPLLVMMSRTG